MYDVWNSPEVLSIVSQIAGVELVPVFDFEIAHINVSINDKEAQEAAKKAIAEHHNRQADEGVSGCPWEDDTPVVDWHTDSYPFVCVVMLSDCSEMIGGETALRTGTGEIMKVRGPGSVSSLLAPSYLTLLQVTNLAPRATPSSFKVDTSSTRPAKPTVAQNESQWSPHSDLNLPSSKTTQSSPPSVP